MASEEADAKLTNLFTKLQDLVANGQGVSKKAVRVVEDILKLAPADADALSAKAVALVKQEKFGDTLVFLKAHPTIAADLNFEKAYSLYRLGRFDEALQAVRGVDGSGEVAALQLEAQIQYRLGNNQEAIRLYSELFQKHKVESLELRTNTVAAYVAGGRSSEAGAVMDAMHSSAADSYELAFNRACALVEQGDYSAAEEQLQLALRTGREDLFEEDIGEQAVEEELAPLTVQLALVHSRLGRHDEALAAYQALEKLELDAATAAVLLNNAAAEGLAGASLGAQPKARIKEALRRLDTLMEKAAGPSQTVAAALQTRLSSGQQETILCNRALLMVAVNKLDAARVAVASFEKQFPRSPKLRLMRASLLARDNKGSEADAALADAPSDVQPLASLMRVQLALSAGDRAAAAARLADLPEADLRYRPAVVANLSALQEQLGDTAAAEATLTTALHWWRNSMTAERTAASAAQAWILRRLARLAIAADRVADAAGYFQDLMALDSEAPANLEVLAALASAYGRQHENGAEALEERLPPVDVLPATEVDALETAVVKGSARRTAKDSSAAPGAAAVGSKREGAAEEAAPKKRRKRKPRLPKNFDPANPGPPPDPERWLPKWQRSDFKKKRDRSARSRKEAVKGSQGAGRVDESLDISKQAISDGPKLPPGKGSRNTAGGGRKKGRR